ncbi:MAG: hypothetical protein ABI760_20820 [Ferruginibacter sp.]
MAHHTITITGSTPNKVQPTQSLLTLSDVSDEGTTFVRPGDTVSWIINVEEIDSILIKDDVHRDLFEPDPSPAAPAKKGSDWTGKIRNNIKPGVETYSIYWSQNGETYGYDPKIQVNN